MNPTTSRDNSLSFFLYVHDAFAAGNVTYFVQRHVEALSKISNFMEVSWRDRGNYFIFLSTAKDKVCQIHFIFFCKINYVIFYRKIRYNKAVLALFTHVVECYRKPIT